jgi:hypothetical protein
MKKTTYMLLAVLSIVGVVFLPGTKPNGSPIKMSLTVSVMGKDFKLESREIKLMLSKNFRLTQKPKPWLTPSYGVLTDN